MEGVGFATGYDPEMTIADMAAWMRKAEDNGFVMGFFSETIELMRDSVTALAAIGQATEHLALGCTQTVRLRNPLVAAQTLASLDELTGGRIFTAPGACTKTHADRYGIPEQSPPVALRETVEAMRALLTGKPVSYHGETVRFDDAQLGWSPLRDYIPMLLPATSTTGLRLAGKIGDGVVLNAICSPEYSANAIEIIRAAAAEEGRDLDDFKIVQIVNVSVEDSHQEALDAVRWEVASKFDPIQLPFIAGPKMRVGEPYIKEEDIPRFQDAWAKGGKQALINAVPDSYVEGMTASGTPDEVVEKVQRYRDVGVQVTILRPAAKHQTGRIIDLFAAA
jgi:alkanesulfonate monooxygenase SsuD/methylene tetrahydromethanopterin reductase-like flavin-dependent oxidoreductase (luciferase family)